MSWALHFILKWLTPMVPIWDKLGSNNHSLDSTGLMRIYTGPDDLYVNHNYTGGNNDGSSSKPFSSFTQLNNYLQNNKTINKKLTIHTLTTGGYVEHFGLKDFAGSGSINLEFNVNGHVVIDTPQDFECGIKLVGNKLKVKIQGYRCFNSMHGILCYRCDNVEITETILNSPLGSGIVLDDSCGYIHAVDFARCYCDLAVTGPFANAYCVTCSGNEIGDAFRAFNGGTIHYGTTSSTQSIPYGGMQEESGTIFKHGETIFHNSWNFPPAEEPPKPPSIVNYNASFNATGLGTYQYQWSNWSSGECKSGVYGSYGDKAGHIFFDLTAVRNFLNSGTVIDGASITLTRANSGGNSAATDIWVGGSSCYSPSGTPAYGNKAKVGQLAWGETKTFALNKAIVDGIKNGSYSSITTHGSGYSNIVACNMILRVSRVK